MYYSIAKADRSVTKTYVFDDYSAFLLFVNEIVVNGPFVEKFFSHLPCVILSISPLDSLVEEQSQNSFLKFIENVEDMYIPLERVVHFL